MENIISAISTANGVGGVAIIRLSGENVLSLLEKMFKPLSKNTKVKDFEPYKLYVGEIDGGDFTDFGMAVFFKGPKSNPKAYAERFIDSVKRDPEIALLSKKLDIVPETYYKNDIVEDRKGSVLYKLFMTKKPDFDDMIADIDKYKIVWYNS